MTTANKSVFNGQINKVSDQRVGLLGHIVWHALPDVRIAESDLVKLAQQHGLNDPPKMGCRSDAFRRATSPTSRRGESRSTRFLIRPVCDTGDKLVRHIVIERVDKLNVVLGHEAVAELTFDKASGQMHAGWLPAAGHAT